METKRRRMTRAERERQMLDVAEEVFATQGYGAVSMEEIAVRVGLSKPMLYEYFGSKEGLLLATITRARRELREATERAATEGETAEDKLYHGYLAYFRFNEAHRRAWLVLLQEPVLLGGAAGEIEATRRQQTDLIVAQMEWLVPDRPRRDLEAYAEIIVGACERLALWRMRNPDVTPEEAARQMMDVTWKGLSAYGA
ncbi:TetR/AcrR family transcriptional regulator [Actinoallomurus oryzae]|uniref:TetR/AcrR family transcriptional regulator n=1 Tax=Actinoallomurus oryzae TaxID=502180 RepID=A0ABP8Q0H1_9ACTN